MRDSTVFYRSFYEAIKDLPDAELVKSFKAIMEYALNGIEPEGNGIEKTVFLLVKPQIDSNNQKYENGKKGGRKKTEPKPNNNQEEIKEEPKENQEVTNQEPNVYVNVNVNDNVNANDNVKKTKRFTPPDVEEVRKYCIERNNNVDPESFVDFYESKGWMIGKNKMKDWKSAVRTWERGRTGQTRLEGTAKRDRVSEVDNW